MTETPSTLAAAKPCLSPDLPTSTPALATREETIDRFIASTLFLSSPAVRDHLIQKLLLLKGAKAHPRSLARHLSICAGALDDLFNQLIRDAVLAPKFSRSLYEIALKSHVLFREIYEYLREHESKISGKRTDKKTLGRRRIAR